MMDLVPFWEQVLVWGLLLLIVIGYILGGIFILLGSAYVSNK